MPRSIVFFAGEGQSEFGPGFRLNRSLSIARELKRRGKSDIRFVCPSSMKARVSEGGFPVLDVDISDLNATAEALRDLSISICIIDMRSSPPALNTLLGGLGALVVSMDVETTQTSPPDISINSYLDDPSAAFNGLSYWVPDEWWSGTAGQACKEQDAIAVKLPRGDTARLHETIRGLRDIRKVRLISPPCNDGQPSTIEGMEVIRDEQEIREALGSSLAVMVFGLEDLFDIVASSRPVILVLNSREEEGLVREMIRDEGVLYAGRLDESPPGAIAQAVEAFLDSPALLKSAVENGTAVLSYLNLHRVCDILEVVKVLEWDSGFFGFKVGYLSCGNLRPVIINHALDFCRVNGVKVLQYLCNCHDRESVLLSEAHGFHFADIRLTFERSLGTDIEPPGLPEGFSFEKAVEDDIPRLAGIAEDIYLDSRYYFDDRFPKDKVRVFYQDWVRKAVMGEFDDYALILRHGGSPAGFCTIRKSAKGNANIGLVGVDSRYSSGGLGRILLLRSLAYMRDQGLKRVEVVTQGRNYRAQRLYQRCGCITKATELWYHKWF